MMAIFGVKDGGLTARRGQMFGASTKNAGSLPAPNIAPPSRAIAHLLSFFIRFFLVKSAFFSGELHCFLSDFLASSGAKIPF